MLHVEMTHPTALYTKGVTRFLILPGDRPPKISAAPTFMTWSPRSQLPYEKPENLSREQGQHQSHQNKERRDVRIHSSVRPPDRL